MNRDYLFKRAAYYYNWILNSSAGKYAQEYLEERGIPLSVANSFMLGATPRGNNGDYYTNVLVKELMKNANPYDVIASKLARIRDHGDSFEVTDFFTTGRLILPVIQNGVPTYFVGRSTKKNDKVRFMNLKGITMEGLFNQDALNTTAEEIYLTEGVMDALTIEAMGKTAMACLGTAGIRPVHRPLFDGINKRFIFVFDADENGSGDKSVTKSASVLKSFGIDSIFKINLPRKKEQRKVDINQLLIRAGNPDTLKDWFDKRERQIVHVEPYQEPMGSGHHKQSSVQIYKVVSRYVTLSQVNPTLYRGKCPLHDDSDPSLHVYTESNTFKCFGCGKWGDPAQFLQDMHNIPYPDAMKKLETEF